MDGEVQGGWSREKSTNLISDGYWAVGDEAMKTKLEEMNWEP